MNILGISAFYHDSAAALLRDGRVVSASEEERFSRVKHDNGFPFKAIDFCLKNAGIKISDVDYVAYYEKPLLKFERILDTFVRTYPLSLRPFVKGLPEWLTTKIKVESVVKKKLGYGGKIIFIPHHLSHAAAAFYPSTFREAAILTVDGVGEYETTALWRSKDLEINQLGVLNFPNSLGLLYSTITAFLGFRVNDDEYKVMGLTAYGKPRFKDELYKTISANNDGSFSLDMSYFSFREGFQMWRKKLETLLGLPRLPNELITGRHRDIAASIQSVTEDVYFRMLSYLHRLTDSQNVCVGGGVALNALANGKIYEKTPFKNVYILGPAGDSGAALGATLFLYHGILKNPKRHKITNLFFGSSYSNEEVGEIIQKNNLNYKKFKNEAELVQKAASLLAKNKIIGWFQGKMEFGPRALGSRSILASPRSPQIKDKVNRIKQREEFRPFAASVLQEHVHKSFVVPEEHSSPFMNFCFRVKTPSRLGAVTHRDGTSRIQTVSKKDGRYYKLIKTFHKITGIPCILNTSFNVKGEPIVENPQGAINNFLKTDMDYLVIGDFLLSKN